MTGPSKPTGRECGAKTRGGGQCRLPAGHGTDHAGFGRCKRHAGSTPTVAKAAKNEMAAYAVQTYGLPVQTDPHSALMDELYRTVGHVEWLGGVIRQMQDAGLKQQQRDKGGMLWDAPAVWVQMYQHERKHLRDVAKTCVDVGIEERMVRVAEQQGALFAQAITSIVRDLGHDVGSEQVRTVVRRHLSLVAA